MTATLPIRFPQWHRVVAGLLWELVWKDKVIFPALIVFLGLGAGLAQALAEAPPDLWWGKYARGTGLIAFFGSVLLTLAPFTLMDSHGSWRMSSVITRWSILPVRTFWLVLTPLLLAWGFLAVLLSAWTPIMDRLFPGFDMVYVLVVFLSGATAAQALAWAIPRKPGQYWVLAALLFLFLLLGAIVPQETAGWAEARVPTMTKFACACLALVLMASVAARRNRCGDWPGELPWRSLAGWNGRPARRAGGFRGPAAALFWSEVAPGWRTFLMSWITLALLLFGWFALTFTVRRPGVSVDWVLLTIGMLIDGLPNFGFVWLLGWGVYLACEPGMGFQTRLSGFRGTRPLTAGMLAGTRMSSLGIAWATVWLPLLFLQPSIGFMGLQQNDVFVLSQQAADVLYARMVFSASAMVAALPILLWGRLEGLPTLFLATLVAWAWTWILGAFACQTDPPDWLAWVLGGVLLAKCTAASWMLSRSLRRGYVTWRFPAGLMGVWLAVVAGLAHWFAPWALAGAAGVLALAVMIPLVRLAACPIAMAANRHR